MEVKEAKIKGAKAEMPQQQVWNEIAEGWTNWRQKPVDMAEKLAQEWQPGKILDIGCGNCRNLLPFARAGFECYGIDFSHKMIELARGNCKKNGAKVKLQVAYVDELPFKNATFDYVITIAVIHHLDTKEKRIKAVEEIKRVLKPGGKALILVWNKLQWNLVFKPKDACIPWKRKGTEYMRYYHLFTHWEMLRLIKATGLRILGSSGPFEKNLQFIVEKKG